MAMVSGASNALAANILNAVLRGVTFKMPRNRYIALFTADPTPDFVAGKEVSASWYQRQPAGTFSAPNPNSTSNQTVIQFAPTMGGSVTVTHIGVVEGASPTDATSTLLFSFPLAESKTLTTNDVFEVRSNGTAGDLNISVV